ncbi:MAG: trypsin-like peptidase domain-containing protein [Elusimicrobia bacterium]|nr:trypsin-like peptidase domain-containing protein [Elusimicrobiota bacterium]
MKTRLLAALLLAACAVRASALLPEEQNTIKVFRENAPSVVFVTNVAIDENMFMDEYAIPQGAGSGIVWDKDGHIVTNYHVVKGGDAFLVTMENHKQVQASLVGRDKQHDIAVLKLDKPVGTLRPIGLGSLDSLQVGQQAIAIGNPFGLDHSLSQGIISALGREVDGIGGVTIRDMIQTDAAINPGNSGGPLLDSDGDLIGMNTMIYSQSGSNAGIGFAVPVSFLKRIVPQLIKYGKVIRPGLGVTILTPGQKYYLLGDQPGVVIASVARGGGAARAGLRGMRREPGGRYALGDVIVGVDGTKIRDYDDLYHALDARKVGDRVTVEVVRGERTLRFRVTLMALD